MKRTFTYDTELAKLLTR